MHDTFSNAGLAQCCMSFIEISLKRLPTQKVLLGSPRPAPNQSSLMQIARQETACLGVSAVTCEHQVQGHAERPRVPRGDAAGSCGLLSTAHRQHFWWQELRPQGPRGAAEAGPLLRQPARPAREGCLRVE